MSRITNKKFYLPDPDAVVKSDEEYMRLAIDAARECHPDEVPVGAVVVRAGEIIAVAANTRESQCDPCGHAEINALRLAAQRLGGWNLHHCTLFVTLEPCAMCAGACINSRIERIVYGACDPKAGGCGGKVDITKQLCHKVEVTGGILGEEAAVILKEFFQKKRKKNKKIIDNQNI